MSGAKASNGARRVRRAVGVKPSGSTTGKSAKATDGAGGARGVLAEIRRLGKASTAAVYRRHGVTQPTVGLSYADLGKLVKKFAGDHELALALWESGLHDARVLAARIADPGRMTATLLGRWLREVDNHVLSGAVAGLAGRAPVGLACAARWIERKAEWPSSTGWCTYAELCAAGQVDQGLGARLLERIARDLPFSPNRTRHNMNAVLISLGGYVEPLRERALEIAARLGKVEVDHGQTGCKTPDAASYIRKMVAHGRKRSAPRARRSGSSERKASARAGAR